MIRYIDWLWIEGLEFLKEKALNCSENETEALKSLDSIAS